MGLPYLSDNKTTPLSGSRKLLREIKRTGQKIIEPLQLQLQQRQSRHNHRKVLQRIRSLNKPLRIVFLCNDNTKWCCQSVWETMQKSPHFEPFLVVVPQYDASFVLVDDCLKKFAEDVNVFRQWSMDAISGFDEHTGTFLDLQRLLNPDVVFYQQPWQYAPNQMTYATSVFALSCYVPYGTMIANNNSRHYTKAMQQHLWRYFAPSPVIEKLYRKTVPDTPQEKIVVTGYPKLDVYLHNAVAGETPWKEKNHTAKRVIYAPHWSIDTVVNYATFMWNHRRMLELAKTYPQIQWLVKPHPMLRQTLKYKNLMSEAEINAYFDAWHNLPNAAVYEQGNYFDIFKTSDCLITDCGSFLAEYLFTQKPVLHLLNPKSVGYNELGQKIVQDFYRIENVPQLDNAFQRIVLDGDDYLKYKRLTAIEHYPLPPQGAGKLIADYIQEEIYGQAN